MKYKFIGTEQDLIDNGFKLIEGWNRLYSKEVVKGEIEILITPVGDIGFPKNEITNNYGSNNIDKKHLKFLIDKGLVVEV